MLYSILELAFIVFDSVLAPIFFLNFNGYKVKEKPAFCILCPMLIIIAKCFNNGFDIVAVMLSVMISFVFMMTFSFVRSTRLRCLWSSFLFYGTLMLVNSIVYSVFQTLMNVRIMYIMERTDVYAAICVISKNFLLLTVITYIYIKERLEYKSKDVNIFNLLFISLFNILIIVIIMRITTVELSFPLTLVMLGLFAGGLIHYYMYAKLSGKAKVELDYKLLKQKTDSDKRLYQEKKEQIENAQRMNHDIKNHLSYIAYFIKSKKYDKATNYIERIFKQMNTLPSNMILVNDTLNFIINCKIGEARKLGIKVTAQIEDIQDCIMDDFELCSLLGNILDNAIEGSEKEENKHIVIEINNYSGYQAYTVKNRIDKSILSQNMALVSNKKDVELHGFGMKQIHDIVSNYQGHLDIYENDNYFNVIFLIPRKMLESN